MTPVCADLCLRFLLVVVTFRTRPEDTIFGLHRISQRSPDRDAHEPAAGRGDERANGALTAVGDGDDSQLGIRKNRAYAGGDRQADIAGVQTSFERLRRDHDLHDIKVRQRVDDLLSSSPIHPPCTGIDVLPRLARHIA